MPIITIADNLRVGAALGGVYVDALDPGPEQIREVIAFLGELGWQQIPEEEDEPEDTDDGLVRIWYARTSEVQL